PLARAGGGVHHAGLRIGVVAVALLAVVLVLGVQWAVPIPFVVVTGIYGAQLAVDDAPLYVAALGVGALVASALLLALADAIRARGLGIDVLGAVAAASALLAVVLFARGRGPTSS